jgi:diguanylate cyclase (GGDEF)-like protein/PAS domain S-box-containing protein
MGDERVPPTTETLSALEPLTLAAESFAGFGRWAWTRDRGFELSDNLRAILTPHGLAWRSAREVLRALTPPSRRSLLLTLHTAMRGESPGAMSLTCRGRDGVVRSLSVTMDIVRDAAGWRLGGLARDVTRVTELAAALERSESRWQMALEGAGQGVWDTDVETGTVYHSRTWHTMRGLDPDGMQEMQHEEWIEHLHPQDRDRILAEIERQHADKISRVQMEYRERLADGSYIWISSLGSIVERGPDGRPRRIIGTDTDITARKEAERQLEQLSRRLALALEVSRVGVYEVNMTTGAHTWDARIREIYGRTPDEPIGPTAWSDALHPDDRDWAVQALYDAYTRGEGFSGQFRIVRPDGEVCHIRAHSIVYTDADGNARILGTNTDITGEMAARDDLTRARDLAEARALALEDARTRIEHNALHDMLTGLPNRRYLDRVLRERWQQARLDGSRIAVLHIDLDRFKQINDTMGHVAGDAMLVHAAQLLKRNLAAGEFVARVGGDEFTIVCRIGDSTARVEELAAEIVTAMRQPVPYNGYFCRFGASIGIAVQRATDDRPESLLVDSDIALYRAKARGKNAYEFFTDTLHAEAVHTKQLADDILRALEQDEFLPHYQPIFDARTSEVAGVEALARWQHPTQGLLQPAVFLAVAEELNVVNVIDEIILEKALADYRRWQSRGFSLPSVSVNVSFRRLLDDELIRGLARLDIPRGVVSFELLESIFLDDLDDTASWNIDALRDMGIGLSIDDFGTGHASIISLLKLRPDRLKIDRQFLEQIETSLPQRNLLHSLIDIGKSLGIKVVAEGVETPAQARILADLGCDMLQGYALLRPAGASVIERLLEAQSVRSA